VSRFRRSLLLLLLAVLVLGAILLGRWQLQRLADRRAANTDLRMALALPPVNLSGLVTDTMLDGRRIVARGAFDTAQQVVLRGRARNTLPGLHVVTAFRPDGGPPVWVLRGFVASADASTPPDTIPAPTAGTVTITGTAYAMPRTDDRGQPIGEGARRTYRRLDLDELRPRIPGSLAVYVIVDGGVSGPGALPHVDMPTLDDGPHLSYALQWFAIAAAIAAFGVIVMRRDGRASPRPRAAP
jgi:cytochrome oxidase assembly protein ShyY1